MRGQLESRFRLFWYCNMPFAVFASAKPHGTRAFARLFVHAGVRFPRPFAGAIGTLFENAKLIFPPGAVETASAAIFIISGTTGLIAVKSRLLLHEQFKRPLLALCEIHSGCTSFPAGRTQCLRHSQLPCPSLMRGFGVFLCHFLL